MPLDTDRLRRAITEAWDGSILSQLEAYIRIPNKSPHFDPEWESHGYMDAAVRLLADWAQAQPIAGLQLELRKIPGRTPLILVEVPGEVRGTVLCYGHLDKQPEFSGWSEGLGPWNPVLRAGRLYGRGGADDGYALFSALSAIAALKAQRIPLPRCVILIEACEESGSIDLPAHLAAIGDRLGDPSLVVCLDAESGDYDRLWCTTSLRGNLTGQLRVRVLTEGVHSGMATGIAPTPFRILEQLLARIEDPATGRILPGALKVALPDDRRRQIAATAQLLGEQFAAKIPWAPGARALSLDPAELIVANTWEPTLAVTGADGLPAIGNAGNVLLPQITLKLSVRLPPGCDARAAQRAMQETLERDPPYGAQVSFAADEPADGWNAPSFAPWLERAMAGASDAVFGQGLGYMGCGGTIPFMGMLGHQFPDAQFFITGVLGPHSNAHGPNEFLDLAYVKKLTMCVAMVLAEAPASARG
ncbi:MAG TPA: M20/M25/M40 family metallo-hydrolase [Steroidobacteraceae bacterium]|jgi:acetylornithine deacetylase/succinyl-diaminopimelate desuccinylase-like protein|nr:M20/M25/M40 family metallo-hydrolase [Steroidobacteraceae bacterium]